MAAVTAAAAAAVAAAASVAATTTNRSFPLRMLVDSDVVGAIIGRSGSTIKSITQQTKARIDVHREENLDQKEKVITITGSPDSCSEACHQILKICHDEYNNQNNLYRGEDGADQKEWNEFPNNPEVDSLYMLAPSSLIGRLIGRGGASIKKIMEQTSTKIKISANNLTESTGEHTIAVSGNLEQIRQAEKLISSKLRADLMSDINVSLQAMNQQPYMFNNVAMPYAAPGHFAPHQNPLLASMVSTQPGHSANPLSRSVPMNHSHQQTQVHNPLYQTPPGYLPLYPGINAPHPAGSGLVGYSSVVPRFEQERETVFIYIPYTMVGAIIGKSGAAIKEMISTSGATIKVATTSPPPVAASSSSPSVERSSDKDGSTKQADEHEAESPKQSNAPSEKDDILDKLEDVYLSPANRNNGSNHKPVNSNDPSSTRRVTIIGYPVSQYSAQYLIYRKVAMESCKNDISLMVEINVPSQLVGKIIGKGGASVKKLQKQTRTTIRLPDDKHNQSQSSQTNSNSNDQPTGSDFSETIVQITGEFEGSQAAQRLIRNLIGESQFSKQTRNKHQSTTRNTDSQKDNNAQTHSNYVHNNNMYE